MWVIAVLAGVFLLLAVIGFVFFKYSTGRKVPEVDPAYLKDQNNPWTIMKPKMDKGKTWIHTKNPERVEITSFDGLKLFGYYLPAEKESGKTILMMHGYHSEDFNDFSCSAKYFHDYGYNLFLADQRCHGLSEGKHICFGVNEKYDCQKWVDYLSGRIGGDIFLMGVSMGCATVVMTLGLKLPENVKGCIADCGFTSPEDIFRHVLKRDFHLPPYPLIWFQNFYCRVIGRFNVYDSTLDALQNNRLPVLFIHGSKDDFVPPWMTMKNFEACKAPKELLIIEGAEHAMSFLREPDKCWAAMKAFVDKWAK